MIRCSSYSRAKTKYRSQYRAPIYPRTEHFPWDLDPGLDPIACLSFSVFIARHAFDPASVCYASRVAHGDRTAASVRSAGRATVSRLNEIKKINREDKLKIIFNQLHLIVLVLRNKKYEWEDTTKL